MKTHFTLTLFFIGVLFLATESKAASATEEYALSERCGKRAEEFYREAKKEADRASRIWFYENHYSRTLNRCFAVEISRSFAENKSDTAKSYWVVTYSLFDMNDHKQFAEYDGTEHWGIEEKMACEVKGVSCRSKKEWDNLVKVYMQD